MSKQQVPESDAVMEALHETYQELQQEISAWQNERGEHWLDGLTPNAASPYLPAEKLPEEAILELMGRLLSLKNRTFSAEELRLLLQQFLSGQAFEDTELLSLFNLALSGVFGLARKHLPEKLLLAAATEETLLCPICGQEPGMTVLTQPVGKRHLHCTSCGHEWTAKSVGCIRCGSSDTSQQMYLKNEDFTGIEIVVCQNCEGDFKEIDLRERLVEDFVWEDLRTLPLNYAAEKWLHDQAASKKALH